MNENPFYRLAPFIQEYIYRQGWEELRAVQVQAAQAILDTPNHVLITSGTASGKTEAAFLPTLTALVDEPAASIGIIYIGPLKALINDQFHRLQGLLEESGLTVQSWHGDVNQSKKQRFLRRAQGVLQITPESMEAMLINRHQELGRLFGDLRFVIIDEVHALIGSDRGRQVMCQLQRLARYQAQPARRIGLSATLGEPGLAQQWLAGGSDLPVLLIQDQGKRPEILLGLEHYYVKPEPVDNLPEGVTPERPSRGQDQADAAYGHMYQLTKGAKTLLFANSRKETEQVVSHLRRLAEAEGAPDIYHVHHGSVSAPLREEAERAMRAEGQPACIGATITLELGIDIGQLDQVVQLNATNSVSSFVQRLGRSGRRGNPARMFFYCREEEASPHATLGQRLPWDLLQVIAIIQLYLEEKWIEPPSIPHLPFSLLYHQTMSILAAQVELTPPELAEQVLTLSPFRAITLDHYRDLLRHLIALAHIEKTETGSLIIGLAAEQAVNHYRFYATFKEETAFQVIAGSRLIGTVHAVVAQAQRFRLAGRTWQVLQANEEQRILFVEQVRGNAKAMWAGGRVEIHGRILQRIRQVLHEERDYGYLQPQAQRRLAAARQLARLSGLAQQALLPLSDQTALLLPWQGTRIMETLRILLEAAGFIIHRAEAPFYLEISAVTGNVHALPGLLRTLAAAPPSSEELLANLTRTDYELDKYDRYVPDHLLHQAFLQDRLDLPGAVGVLGALF